VRLGGLIEQSDTVVFVVSPEAVTSERCVWEVDRTIELSKRLLPVIFKSVAEHEIPKTLSRLQFVRFDTGRGITRPLTELAEALQQDGRQGPHLARRDRPGGRHRTSDGPHACVRRLGSLRRQAACPCSLEGSTGLHRT
jgi:hypothetical protein